MRGVFTLVKQCVRVGFHALQERFFVLGQTTNDFPWTRHAPDLTKSKSELLAENARLRHQLIIIR